MRISKEALSEIEQSLIDTENFTVKLVNQLDRNVYTEVNEVFKRLNGKWIKKTSSHKFEENPKAHIEAILTTQEMPPKNPTAYFPTPNKLVQDMLRIVEFNHYASYKEGLRVLEPSAGSGNIASVIKECAKVNIDLDLVEYLPLNQNILKQKGFDPICGDFIEYNTDYDKKYDFVFMNPPFSLEHDKKAYITHVEHAFNMLDWNGVLVAILPTGWLQNTSKKERNFFNFVAEHGTVYLNDKKSFKESGTLVDTVIIEVYKSSWKNKPYCTFKNYHIWSLYLHIDNDNKTQKKLESFLTQENDPSDNEITGFLIDAINQFSKEQNLHSFNFMDLYLEEFKERRKNEKEYELENTQDEIVVPIVSKELEKVDIVEPLRYVQKTLF